MPILPNRAVALALSLLAAAAAPAHADQLDELRSRGTLVCAVLDIFEPFSFTEQASRTVAGYDVDICHAVAQRLGLKAQVRAIADASRIPALQQGHVDLLAAGLAYTPERATQIDYSHSYYVSNNVLAIRRDKGYQQIGALAGKRISYVKGTISEPFVRQALPTAMPVGYDDVATAFTALVQNKVEAFSTSEEAMHKLINRLGDQAGRYAVLAPPIGRERWSIGVRKGQDTLLRAVNAALQDMETSGQMQVLFDKWLGPATPYAMTRSFTVSALP